MLLVLARLQSFDPALEEAALDLGASHIQVMRRIIMPHLYPAIGAGRGDRVLPVGRELQHHPVHARHRRHADGLCRLEGAHAASRRPSTRWR